MEPMGTLTCPAGPMPSPILVVNGMYLSYLPLLLELYLVSPMMDGVLDA